MLYDIDIEFDLPVADGAEFMEADIHDAYDRFARGSAARKLGDGVDASCLRCDLRDNRSVELQFRFAHIEADSAWKAAERAVGVLNDPMGGLLMLHTNDTLRIAVTSEAAARPAGDEAVTELAH